MDIKDIQNLIKFVSKSDVAEVTYKTDEFEISIKTNKDAVIYNTNMPHASHAMNIAPTNTINSHTTAPTTSETEISNDTSKLITIKSPMIGTFYRKPAPDKDYFVNVGDNINIGNTVCVIEAMKLFNEIESEISGKIVKILAEDASPVEFDQPLFLVDPS
ncbi:acetyl-CoA carboxylase biotin carboxyl carrier protein [Apibacter muscae]|uniref:acetyl-CoA carboxylase biotin carboxyl carrier protein n=1 Tax=Apibacter muscae TaxID=2509004 RepID=UPI0011AC064B|nr:acetyl-CoA carboxylase biotin carboxyl carrier protein [Apibacter muscae]TWP23480.1 acetyl-CoA carboxylase biotin carboxyl carrier protein [Apibacter muscae]